MLLMFVMKRTERPMALVAGMAVGGGDDDGRLTGEMQWAW